MFYLVNGLRWATGTLGDMPGRTIQALSSRKSLPRTVLSTHADMWRISAATTTFQSSQFGFDVTR